MTGISIISVDGSVVDGITITNIAMEDIHAPIYIRLANRGRDNPHTPPQPGKVRNIVISNITARHSIYASSITAISGCYVENVVLDNLNFGVKGGGNNVLAEKVIHESTDWYPDANCWRDMPASGFFVRNVKGLDMRTIRIRLDEQDERPVLIFDNAKEINVNNFKMDSYPNGHAAIRLTGVENAKFADISFQPTEYDFDLRGQNDITSIIHESPNNKVHNH